MLLGESLFSIRWDAYPEVELLDPMIILLNLGETAMLFFKNRMALSTPGPKNTAPPLTASLGVFQTHSHRVDDDNELHFRLQGLRATEHTTLPESPPGEEPPAPHPGEWNSASITPSDDVHHELAEGPSPKQGCRPKGLQLCTPGSGGVGDQVPKSTSVCSAPPSNYDPASPRPPGTGGLFVQADISIITL